MRILIDREVEEFDPLNQPSVEQLPPEYYESYTSDGMYLQLDN